MIMTQRKAFTLVELLVVIGIVVLLISILLVALHMARLKADQARMAADLQTIAIALDAYKADFGDYPRVRMDVATAATPGKFLPVLNWGPPDIYLNQYISGAELLCWALVGPYDEVPGSATFNPLIMDGYDGPGFRLNPRQPGPDGVYGRPPADTDDIPAHGQVYASYLNVERFRFGVNAEVPRYPVLLDSRGNPILYFPLTPRPAGQAYTSIADRWNPADVSTALDFLPAYDTRDNDASFWRGVDVATADYATPLARMRVMLGDTNANGIFDPGETMPPTLPFLLWSAGPDGFYGPTNPANPADVNNCDDVTNLK